MNSPDRSPARPPAAHDSRGRGRAPDVRVPGPARHHHPRLPDVRRRGVHRADGLDGPDAAGQPQGGGLPELRDPVRAGAGRGGQGRPAGLRQLRAGRLRRRAGGRMPGRPAAGAEGPLRLAGGRTAGRSPSSASRASRRRRTSSGWSGCRASRSRSSAATSTSTAGSPASRCAEQRAMRILVFDNNFVPRDADRNPRWVARRGGPARHLPSGWRARGTSFVHESDGPGDSAEPTDWLEYRHWDPDRGRSGPSATSTSYNGGDVRGENRVADLMLEARVAVAARRPGRPDPAPLGRRSVRGLAPGRRPGRRRRSAATGAPLATTRLGGTLASSPRRVAPLRDRWRRR